MLQRHAIQKFHGDESLPVLVVDFVDGADVRVIERGGSFGFALEAAQSLCITGEFISEELQGYATTEL
jgi:hypothetical protein